MSPKRPVMMRKGNPCGKAQSELRELDTIYNEDCLKNLDTRGDINAAVLSGTDRLRVRVLRVIYEVCNE